MPIKIYKRNDRLYFVGMHPEDNLKRSLRFMAFDRLHKIWYTPATYTTFIDTYRKYKDLFVSTDSETAAWISESKAVIKRMMELQTGIKGTNAREIVLPNTIDYVLEPFQHQKEAIAFALNVPKSALWLDMGLGKTYTSITIAKLRHSDVSLGGINKVLVVCPRSLMYQWEQEIRHFAPSAEVFVIQGTLGKKVSLLEQIPQDKFSFTIITYEGVFSSKQLLANVGYEMFILDEATKMKNPKAKRTLSTAELCQDIPYGLSLTGMAYVSNPLDLFAQFLVIDKTVYGDNQWVFSNRYIDYKILPFARVISGFKHMDELKARAYFNAFSRTKNQCLDLPPRVYQVRKLPIYEAQYAWYTNLLEQIQHAYELQDEIPQDDSTEKPLVTVNYVVAMLEKFQQITSGFIRTDDGEFIWLDSPKYEEMYNVIKESSDHFIVWARHSFVLKKISEYLAAHDVDSVILDRNVSSARRKMIKEEFKKGKIRVLILQLQSECRGNDFTCETGPVSSIFFENTASIEERAQAEDRQHRIGMCGTAVYVDLVCEDTYDEGIKFLLDNKKQISDYIREKNLQILLGKGGSIGVKKTRSKKRPKLPSDIKKEELPQVPTDPNDLMMGLEQ